MKSTQAMSFEIIILANLMRRKLNDCGLDSEKDGLKGMQGWIIGFVKDQADRPVFQRGLEKQFNIRRATVTGVLQTMERNGLILRKSVDYDARLKRIVLTSKAIELLERSIHTFQDFEKEIRRGINEEEIATFFAIAEKLKKNIE